MPSISVPSMPTISMPEMPSISAPTMDGKFYKPSLPQTVTKTSTSDSSTSSETTSTETSLSDSITTEELLLSLFNNSNLLSASDISGLYDTGLFSDISSLSGTDTSSTSVLLLKEILQKLNELKADQRAASAAEQELYAAKIQDSETFKARNPSVLRFKINGYSIKDSLVESFFSEPEVDGSFLLTADRKYFVNNKAANETFYMLFKTIKSNGNTTTYSVTPSIAQGVENKESYVYKLCQLKDITAEKTGNLVVVHYNDNGLSADLLLDIDR